MNRKISWLYAGWVALILPACSHHEAPAGMPPVFTVKGGNDQLMVRAFRSPDSTDTPVLVVVLHGDAPRNNPGYQYEIAAKIAASCPDVVVAAILRPGYTDRQGNKSEGVRGLTVGDNWSATYTDAIADAITELRLRYHARKVVVAGHSGGASITGNILGRHSDLIDAALLVSCPCDVAKWRESMFKLTGEQAFQGKIDTLSPLDSVPNISPKVPITMLVGKKDDVAPPMLSEAYRDAAQKAGKQVKLLELEGKTHEIFDEPEVFKQVSLLVEGDKERPSTR